MGLADSIHSVRQRLRDEQQQSTRRGGGLRFAGQRPVSDSEAFWDNAVDSATFGAGTHVGAAYDAVRAGLSGQDMRSAYGRRVRQTLDRLEYEQETNPGWAFGGAMAGTIPYWFVGAGEASAAGRAAASAPRAASFLGRANNFARDAVNLNFLPGMRALERVGRGGGIGASAAQFLRAGYTGVGYGLQRAATHSRTPEEFGRSALPSMAAGGIGGVAAKGMFQTLGARNPALRILSGGGTGALVGGTGNLLLDPEAIKHPWETFQQGAQIGGAVGAGAGVVANPLLLGWADRNLVTRMASGGFLGGAAGLMYANQRNNNAITDDQMVDPAQAALGSAAFGSALSAGGRPMMRILATGAQQAWENPNRVFGSHSPMAFIPGLVPMGGRTPEGLPRPPGFVARQLETDIRRSGRSVADVENSINEIEQRLNSDRAVVGRDAAGNPVRGLHFDRRPIGGAPIDIEGVPEFRSRADTLAQMPGTTRTDVQNLTANRVSNLADGMRDDLRHFLGGSRSPTAIQQRYDNLLGNISRWYNNVLGRPLNPEGLGRMRQLAQAPEMQPTLRTIFEQEESRLRLARSTGAPEPVRTVVQNGDGYQLADDISGRGLQVIKHQLDTDLEAAANRGALPAAERTRLQVLDDWRGAWNSAMRDAIPGYATVTGRRQSMYRLHNLLNVNRETGRSGLGRQVLTMRPEEIARFMERGVDESGRQYQRSRLERYTIRMAVADEISRRIAAATRTAGGSETNAAKVLASDELQNQLRAVFGEDAARQFLDRVLERGRQVVNVRSITGNSATANRLARMAEHAYNSVYDALQLDAKGAMSHTGLAAHALEERNNALGSYLTSDLSSAAARRRWRALLPELYRLERERIARGNNAGTYGIGGGGAASWADLIRNSREDLKSILNPDEQ